MMCYSFFFSSRRRHTRLQGDWSSDVCSSDLVVASMSGCAGQRCMAASVMVAVSKTDHIIERMVEHARAIVPGRDIGPEIGRASCRERKENRADEYVSNK